eukprot:7702674-Pyramimonas_sp.AAC.1
MVKAWLHILPALMRERVAFQAAWTNRVEAMKAAVHPWGKARGSITALVTTLIQNGWGPQLSWQCSWSSTRPHQEEPTSTRRRSRALAQDGISAS